MVAPQPSRLSDGEVLDAIVIGGGPAGLSAALVLGRCLRRVLVCDAGHPRNEPARMFNGFLSRDGSTPAEFLQICREPTGIEHAMWYSIAGSLSRNLKRHASDLAVFRLGFRQKFLYALSIRQPKKRANRS